MGNYYIANTTVLSSIDREDVIDSKIEVDYILVSGANKIKLLNEKFPLDHPAQGTEAGFVFGGHVPFSYYYPATVVQEDYHAYNDAVQTLSLKSIEKFNFTTPAPSTEVGELSYTSPVDANSGATGWASLNSSTHGYAAFGQDILHGTVPQPYPNGTNRDYSGFSTQSIEKFPFAISSGTATDVLDPSFPANYLAIHRTGLSSPSDGYLFGGVELKQPVTPVPYNNATGFGSLISLNRVQKFSFAAATPIVLDTSSNTIWYNPSDTDGVASNRSASVGFSTSVAGFLAGGGAGGGYLPDFNNRYKSIEKIVWSNDNRTYDVGDLEWHIPITKVPQYPDIIPPNINPPNVASSAPTIYTVNNPPYVDLGPTYSDSVHFVPHFYLTNGGVTGPTHGYTLNLGVTGYASLPGTGVDPGQVYAAYGISRFQKFPFSITSGQSAILFDAQILQPFTSFSVRGFQASPPGPAPGSVDNPIYYKGTYPQYEYNSTIIYSNLVGHQTPTDGYLSGHINKDMIRVSTPTSSTPVNGINKFPFSSDNFITADVGDLLENRSNHGGVSH